MELSDRQKILLGITEQDVLKIPILKAPKTVSAAFIPPSWYPLLSHALTQSSKRGAMIFGPRGSGKSTAIRELARANGVHAEPMQCGKNEQIDSLLGTWTVVGGNTLFVDGPLTLCVRNGFWLMAEEANAIHPAVWSKVNTLTDATGDGLRLPTGEVVANHPSFRLILLYNDGYLGTQEVNPALKDRLPPIYAGYPAPAIERAMLAGIHPSLTGTHLDRLIQLAGMIRAANIRNFDLSIRALDWFAELYLAGVGTWSECYRMAIMDLLGAPELTGPARAVLGEIAKNCGMEQW